MGWGLTTGYMMLFFATSSVPSEQHKWLWLVLDGERHEKPSGHLYDQPTGLGLWVRS